MLHAISFPKSGRTWLRVMLDDLKIKATFSHEGSDYTRRQPFSDINANKDKFAKSLTLLLLRDPRDVVVSGYFQASRREGLEAGTLSQFIRDNRFGIAKVCHFNLQWLMAGRSLERFALLTYEQMRRSPERSLSAVAELSGIRVDGNAISEVASRRTFARMRIDEASGELGERYGEILRPARATDLESFKVRRGLIGGYRSYLNRPELNYCNAVLHNMKYWTRLDAAVLRWDVARKLSIYSRRFQTPQGPTT